MATRVPQLATPLRLMAALVPLLCLAACGAAEPRKAEGAPATSDEAEPADAGSSGAASTTGPSASDPAEVATPSTGDALPADGDDGADSQGGTAPDGTQAGLPGSDAGSPEPSDADVSYTGLYGQPISLRLPYLDKEWSIDASSALVHVKTSDAAARFIIEHVRATATSNSNAQYDARIDGTVYLRDVFSLRVMGSEQQVYFDAADRRFKVGATREPAEFLLTNKYGSNIEQVDSDAYCKGVFDSFEYFESPNNRNTSCEFPYTDCYGRCAFRKLFFVQNGKYHVVGLSTKAPTDHVTIDGITGYQSYEYLLP